MIIGLDIDNVITDMDKSILKEFLLEDKNKRGRGIINPDSKSINHGMFDWTQKEVDEFYNKNMERIAHTLSPRKNCKFFMDKLLNDGHELILISHRAYPHYNDPYNTTLNWLKKNKINFTKLILSKKPDKTEECLENKIDIMIDDRVSQCKKMMLNGVNCFVMTTRYNKKKIKDEPFFSSWKNLYDEITKISKMKI